MPVFKDKGPSRMGAHEEVVKETTDDGQGRVRLQHLQRRDSSRYYDISDRMQASVPQQMHSYLVHEKTLKWRSDQLS
jgi:hypothetical protein